MTPFRLRRRLVHLLTSSIGSEEVIEETVEEDTKPEGLVEGDTKPTIIFALPPVPPGMLPGMMPPAASPGMMMPPGMPGMMMPPGMRPSPPMPPASPTMRNGPTGSTWAMKVVDCNDQMDPSQDAEIQGLLGNGWEPFSVHKFHSFTGAEGVRVYLKRMLSQPGFEPKQTVTATA